MGDVFTGGWIHWQRSYIFLKILIQYRGEGKKRGKRPRTERGGDRF